ncbi:unnamed protein product [Ambrosiozyma monospora]|uniref:Unnamed protein product n=1 Tax=Ambrosiozyma monospora TaxID=43982 RepID=A0A9W6SWK2_AMBMO|nr:unnamed protein product [Ambrosiozyma monospora]
MYNSNFYLPQQPQQPPQQQQQPPPQQVQPPIQFQPGYGSSNNFGAIQPLSTPSSSSSSFTNNAQIPQLWMGELDQRWDETTIRQIWTRCVKGVEYVYW